MTNNQISNNNAFVHLQSFSGGDLSVVNAARVSYGKSSVEMTEADRRLIGRLLRDSHGSVFEHSYMTFYVKLPIFVAREWMRHRIGGFNEVSGRYKELTTDFYTPKKFRVPITGAKQMDYQYAAASDEQQAMAKKEFEDLYEHAEAAYRKLLAAGIAKEHAQDTPPSEIYTEFIWTVNARSLMNFLKLRNAKSAQGEIQMYARAIEKLWSDVMPVTHAAFCEHGRVAP